MRRLKKQVSIKQAAYENQFEMGIYITAKEKQDGIKITLPQVDIDAAIKKYLNTDIDNVTIVDIDCSLYYDFSKYSLTELNQLAKQLSNLSDEDFTKVTILVEDVKLSIEKALATYKDYILYDTINSEVEVAYKYIDDMGGLNNLPSKFLDKFFDYEAFGEMLVEQGNFYESVYGYLKKTV